MFPLITAVSLYSRQATPLSPSGTLTIESGEVQLVRKGQPSRACRKREPLFEGDTLTIPTSGRALVSLHKNHEVWRLLEATTVKISPRSLHLVQGQKPILATHLPIVQADPGRTMPLHLASVVRGETDTFSLTGTVRRLPISLECAIEPWSTYTLVEVFSPTGTLLWKTSLSNPVKSTVTLPTNLVQEGIWYRVRATQRGVRGSDGTMPHSTHETPLRLLPHSRHRELEKAETTLRTELSTEPVTLGLALGELYADFGLTAEFTKAITLAFGDKFESGEALWQLGQWYERAKQDNLALAAYQRAWERGVHEPELKKAIDQLSRRVR